MPRSAAAHGVGGLPKGQGADALRRVYEALAVLAGLQVGAHNGLDGVGYFVGSKGGLQHLGPGGFTRVGEAAGIRSEVMALATDRGGGVWVTTYLDGLFYCQDGRCEPVPL